jgi:hypothetical protein
MLKPLLILLCSCASLFVYSQEFRYSFSGNLTVNQLSRLNDSLKRLPLLSCSIHLKSDQAFGELFFHLETQENFDSPPLFTLVDLKKIFHDFGLCPLNCIVFTKPEER